MKKLRYLLLMLLLPAFVLTGCSKDDPEEPIRYTVAFNSNGGSAVDPQTVEEGQKATRPAEPAKADNTFGGWYKDAALTALYDFNAAVTANVTLYARWIAASATTYTVTFNSNGGSPVDPQTVEEGRKATEPPTPTKAGQNFAGWFSSADLSATWDFATEAVTADITLYAKWIPTVTGFTVTFEANGGSDVPAQNVSEGGKVIRPAPPTKEGLAFAGWYTDPELTMFYDFNAAVTADLILYAEWANVSLETLGQLLGAAWELNENRYTTESFHPIYEARQFANDVMNYVDPTYDQVVEAYETLSAALAGLVEAPYRAVAKIDIWPSEIDGCVYVRPDVWFYLNANGVTADGNSATDSRVIFEATGLEAWAMEEPGINVGNDQIAFLPKDDLVPGTTFVLTIRSMDLEASHIVRSVTLKVASATEFQDRFIALVDALPDPAAIDYQHNDAIEEAYQFYWLIPYEIRDQLTDAYVKLRACENAYNELPERLKFSFSGNICTMRSWYGGNEEDVDDPVMLDFAASGAFPAGTYTERGWSDYGYGYGQTRLTLRADGTFMFEYREANDAQGANATPWEEDGTGTYTITGNKTSGGVLYLTDDDVVVPPSPQVRSADAAASRPQPVRRGLHRSR